jgi:outer membrane protein assembly factor BamB
LILSLGQATGSAVAVPAESPSADRPHDWSRVALELIRQEERHWQQAWLEERERRLALERKGEELQQTSRGAPAGGDASADPIPAPVDAMGGDTQAFRGPGDLTAESADVLFYRGGNARTGYAGGGAPHDLRRLWTFGQSEQMFLASPLVAGGAVYAAASRVTSEGSRGTVVCLDATDGQTRWISEGIPDPATGAKRPWKAFFSSPGISADHHSLIIGQGLHRDRACELICLDTRTGRIRWLVPTPLHIEGSPAIEGDVVVAGAGAVEGAGGRPSGDPGFVFAVRISDGQLLWQHPVNDPESSPAIEDGIAYIGSGFNGNAVVALRTGTEEELQQEGLDREVWRATTPQPAIGTVTISDDLVLVGCGKSNYIFTSPEPEAAVLALDRRSGRLRWAAAMPETVLAPIAVRDGVAVCCAVNGEVLALDIDGSGRVLWRQAVREGSLLKSGPAFAGETLYVATHDGYLLVLNAADGSVLEEHVLNSQQESSGRGLTVSSPFVSGGRLFVGSETGGLQCFVGQDVR